MFELPWDAIDPFLIRVAIVWSVILLLRKTMPITLALAGIALVVVGGEYDPLYQAFMAYWPHRNPQLSTLIYLCILWPLLILQLLVKNRRSADRVIMAMVLGAVSVTTTLFHSSLITGVMPRWQEEINLESRTLLMLNDQAFLAACQLSQRECDINGDINALPVSKKIREGLKAVEQDTQQTRKKQVVAFSYAELNDIQSKDIAFITFYADQQQRLIVLAKSQAEHVHYTIKQLFYFLASVAHSFWLSLGLFLMVMHRRMLLRARNHSPGAYA